MNTYDICRLEASVLTTGLERYFSLRLAIVQKTITNLYLKLIISSSAHDTFYPKRIQNLAVT
jgi:hypothetical protein